MEFRMYEHPDSKNRQMKKKKRVLKAESKNIKYIATSNGMNVADRNQGMDYYLGVVSHKDDNTKVYTMPVDFPYQFTQEINGFKEKYDQQGDNEAIKNMTYMEKKALLVQNFGVLKAKRATASLITNKVQDDGVVNKDGKGTRDQALQQRAAEMQKDAINNQKLSKKQKYSKEALFPDEILSLIPYRQTYEALKLEDKEALSKLLSTFARISMENQYQRFEHIESKSEKKMIMKQHVYLDALLTVQRLPNQIVKSVEELSEKIFKGLDVEAIRAILEKFTDIQSVNMNDLRKKKGPNHSAGDKPVTIKFVKTKEKQKILLCYIIAASMHISTYKRLRAQIFARTLKMEVGDLKNYFKDIGLTMESIKNKDGEADIMLYLYAQKKREEITMDMENPSLAKERA